MFINKKRKPKYTEPHDPVTGVDSVHMLNT